MESYISEHNWGKQTCPYNMTNVIIHCFIEIYDFECRRVWRRAAGEDPLQQEGFSTDSDG